MDGSGTGDQTANVSTLPRSEKFQRLVYMEIVSDKLVSQFCAMALDTMPPVTSNGVHP